MADTGENDVVLSGGSLRSIAAALRQAQDDVTRRFDDLHAMIENDLPKMVDAATQTDPLTDVTNQQKASTKATTTSFTISRLPKIPKISRRVTRSSTSIPSQKPEPKPSPPVIDLEEGELEPSFSSGEVAKANHKQDEEENKDTIDAATEFLNSILPGGDSDNSNSASVKDNQTGDDPAVEPYDPVPPPASGLLEPPPQAGCSRFNNNRGVGMSYEEASRSEFYSKEKFQQYLKVLSTNCPVAGCNMTFSNKPQYYIHLNEVHNIFYYQCHAVGCHKSFADM